MKINVQSFLLRCVASQKFISIWGGTSYYCSSVGRMIAREIRGNKRKKIFQAHTDSFLRGRAKPGGNLHAGTHVHLDGISNCNFIFFLRQVVETLLTSGRGKVILGQGMTRRHERGTEGGHRRTPRGHLGDTATRVIFLPQNTQRRESYLWQLFPSLSTTGPEPLMTLEEEGRKGELRGRKGGKGQLKGGKGERRSRKGGKVS